MIKKILMEPLLHFLLLGAILYFYISSNTINTQQNTKTSITLTQYEQNLLKQDNNNSILLQHIYLYKKTLLAEAYTLELDKKDKKIQEILLHKIRKILTNIEPLKEPTEQELKKFYLQHKEQYKNAHTITFKIKKIIENTHFITEAHNIFNQYDTTPSKTLSQQEIIKKYGKYISLQLFQSPLHIWKTIPIKNNTYLIYILHRNGGKQQPFESVEDLVYQDYMLYQNVQRVQQGYKQLLKHYNLEIKK